MTVRRGVIAGSALALVSLIAACPPSLSHPGSGAAAAPKSALTVAHSSGPAAVDPGVVPPAAPPCVKETGAPRASRLPAPRDYPRFQVNLGVVDRSVSPKISARQAFSRLTYDYQGDPGSCGITEVLAYWSSATPATMPADCEPHATLTAAWTPPTACPATPTYPHVLAWVFTWRSGCDSTGGPAAPVGVSRSPVPTMPPFACTAIMFVNATTGRPGDGLAIGGS